MRIVALDLGVHSSSFCELSPEGKVIGRTTVRDVKKLLQERLGPNALPARVAFEACREGWFVAERLAANGHEPVMVDTTRLKQVGIGQHGRKTDRIDAERLARALAQGTIPRAHLLSKPRQELRLQLGVRRALVETRAQYTTTVRGIIRARGERMPACETSCFVRRVKEAALSEETRAMIAPLLEVLGKTGEQIAQVECKLEVLAAQEPAVDLLTTCSGVGPVVAAAFVSVIDEAARFGSAHQVESYLGLVPAEHTSTKRRLGSITKQGNAYLRSLLVQAAWGVLRQKNTDDPLRRWGEAVAERRGKRIAVVAVARRLVGVLWAMWRDGTVYDSTMLGRATSQGIERQADKTLQVARSVAEATRRSSRRAVAS